MLVSETGMGSSARVIQISAMLNIIFALHLCHEISGLFAFQDSGGIIAQYESREVKVETKPSHYETRLFDTISSTFFDNFPTHLALITGYFGQNKFG